MLRILYLLEIDLMYLENYIFSCAFLYRCKLWILIVGEYVMSDSEVT